jgi:hypothetical protein
MGVSTDGILAYGYDFGSEEAFQLREAQESDTNPYGFFKTDWYDAETADDEDLDGDDEERSVIALLAMRLYEAIPGAPAVEYASDCEDPVKAHYGVWFESYCSGEYPMYILATSVTTVDRGDTQLIDPFALGRQPVDEGWDGKLAEALRVLGVTPLQERPGWLLASYWG